MQNHWEEHFNSYGLRLKSMFSGFTVNCKFETHNIEINGTVYICLTSIYLFNLIFNIFNKSYKVSTVCEKLAYTDNNDWLTGMIVIIKTHIFVHYLSTFFYARNETTINIKAYTPLLPIVIMNITIFCVY